MDLYNLGIGFFLVLIGVLLISLYNELDRKQKTEPFSFKLGSAGLGTILIGVYLIINEILN